MQKTKLNLGCGSQTPQGWINVDYALGAHFMKIPYFKKINKHIKFFNLDWDNSITIHNLSKPFPWKTESVDIIYSSHVLEHFTKTAGITFLHECHRILKPQGIIRIVVPDLEAIVDQYKDHTIPADDFLARLDAVYNPDRSFKDRIFPKHQIPHLHKCMYDTKRLSEILTEMGFEVSAKAAFESSIADIKEVELLERTQNAVIVECVKP